MLQKSTNIDKEVLISMYSLFQKYFAAELLDWNAENWTLLASALEEMLENEHNEKIKVGIDKLKQITNDDAINLRFDYNKLHVGPDKLLAPPYESYYLNPEKELMQRETLKVRAFYDLAGLQIRQKYTEPEDHFAFEFEFITYLLVHADEQQDYLDLYKSFLKKHMKHWYTHYCEKVHNNAENPINLAIASILEGFLNQVFLNGDTKRRIV